MRAVYFYAIIKNGVKQKLHSAGFETDKQIKQGNTNPTPHKGESFVRVLPPKTASQGGSQRLRGGYLARLRCRVPCAASYVSLRGTLHYGSRRCEKALAFVAI